MDEGTQIAMCRTVGDSRTVMCIRRKDGTTQAMTMEERQLLYKNRWYRWIIRNVHISKRYGEFVCSHYHPKEEGTIRVAILADEETSGKSCHCAPPACVWCVLESAFSYRAVNQSPRCWGEGCDRVYDEASLAPVI